jgi:hypothetical protein
MLGLFCSRNIPAFVRQSRRFLASSSAVCKSYALDGKGWDVLSGQTTRIGCASGFWGDSPSAGGVDLTAVTHLCS